MKVNGSFNFWKDLPCGVLQGSILGPLLLNIYIRGSKHIDFPFWGRGLLTGDGGKVNVIEKNENDMIKHTFTASFLSFFLLQSVCQTTELLGPSRN